MTMDFATNSLTIALASLGGVVVAGVVAHGAWQARKAGPKRADAPGSKADAREPVMDGPADAPGAVAAEHAEGDAAATPTSTSALIADAAELAMQPADRRPNRRIVNRLDALIDSIARLSVDAPLAGAIAVAHLPTSRRAGGKPFAIEGLNAQTGAWELPTNDQHYGEFQAGVQLANRTGPLNEIEFSEFVQKVQSFADAVGVLPDFPDMLEAVAAARELDAFAAQHDAQVAVHLQARAAAWSVGYIQQHAGRHGFAAGVVPGRLVMPSTEEGAPPVLTLTFDSQAALADDPNLAAVRDVTLSFDVPQTDPQFQPFAAWQASAEALSLDMDAHIVDDDGRPLTSEGFDAIGGQLGQLYAALQGRDLAAGSIAARRLFS